MGSRSPENVEPVAWRWRAKDGKHWSYDPSDAWREAHKDDPNIEFQALYTEEGKTDVEK